MNCQLSLPFSVIQKLGENQQLKLLICQSKKIELSEWEQNALQDICNKKGWVRKGVAIVHRYAGCIDEILQCFSRLNQSIHQLRDRQSIDGDNNSLLDDILTISVIFIRLYYTLCHWRKLQWTPRPIGIEEEGVEYTISEYIAMKLNQVAASLMVMNEKHLKLMRKVPVELLTMIFSPIQMYEGIGELHTRLATAGTSLSLTLPNHNASTLIQDIAKVVIDIFNLEDLIDEKWKTPENSQLSPPAVLCIPYSEIKNSPVSVKWFVSAFDVYERNIKVLRTLATVLLESYPRIKASDCLADGLITLIDGKKKSSMAWHNSWYQSMSITNQFVLQSLSPVMFRSPTTTNSFSSNQFDVEGYNFESSFSPHTKPMSYTEINHPLSPVHIISKDSNASSTYFDSDQLRATKEKRVPKSQSTNQEFHSDSSRDALSSDHSMPSSGAFKAAKTNNPEVCSEDGDDPPSHASNLVPSVVSVLKPSTGTDIDISIVQVPPTINYNNSNRGRVFSADVVRSNQSWKRKRMLSDPVSGLNGKTITISKPSLGRSRTWSVRGRLAGIDFSSTMLTNAFRIIDDETPNEEERAARKIAIWYMAVAPRRKLMNRLTSRDCATEMINLILDNTHQTVQIRFRRRKQLLRQGAAMKIQRAFRSWVTNVLEEERRIEREERKRIAGTRLDLLAKAVHNGIRIYRYIRYAIKKKLIKREAKQIRPAFTLIKTIDMYCQLWGLHKRLEMQKQLQDRMAMDKSAASVDRRINIFRTMEKAVRLIQKLVRAYIARKHLQQLKALNDKNRTVTVFVAKCLGVRRRKRQERLDKSAKVLQKFLRGFLARRRLFKVVNAGLLMNTIWRKYTAYRSLKSQLRRVEKPHTIIIHGIDCIPPRMFLSGTVTVKVLVWWNPLLHIVGHNDYLNFLQTKQPQYIYTCGTHKVVSEEVGENAQKADDTSFDLRSTFSIATLSKLGSKLGFNGHSSSSSGDHAKTENVERKHSLGFGWNNNSDRKKSVTNPDASSSQQKVATPPLVTTNSTVNTAFKKPLPPPSFVRSNPHRNNLSTLSAVKEGNEKGDSRSNSVVSAAPPITNIQRATEKSAHAPSKKGSIVSPAAMLAASRNANPRHSPSKVGKKSEDDDDDEKESDEDSDNDDDENDFPAELNSNVSFKRNVPLPSLAAASSKPDEAPGAAPNRSRLTLRQTLTYALKLGQLANREKQAEEAPKKIRISSSFDDETIKIPGCHGNGVFRFEVYDGERKVGYSNFFLNQRGYLMYWGGEYQEPITITSQKRAVQLNAQVLKKNDEARVSDDGPKIGFRIVAGAPLRSRCQWGRVVGRGKGPFKRMLQNRDVMSSLTIFDSWYRFFFSLDEFGLYLFDNKFNCEPFYMIPVTDLKSVSIDLGAPIRTGSTAAKNIVEDINNVILKTYAHDELYIRFPDAASRVAWSEVFQNAIDYQSHSHNPAGSKRNWFGKTFFDQKTAAHKTTTIDNMQPLAPSEIASHATSEAPSVSPLKSKYLSHFLSLTGPASKDADDDEDEDEDDDDDDDDDNEKEGGNLSSLYNNSIGLIANTSLFNSKQASNVAPPSKAAPPPPRNSPISINSKSRTPPIFSVPFKGGASS